MTKTEKIKVKAIIDEYQHCYEKIEKLEKQIEQLLDNKNQLVDELHSIRNSEMEVISELQIKYGEDASIDLENLEILNGKA
tara:strand:+ start:2400 stop:2642 length:243 start_codon:yes stop_codon:yes gene_type:complete